MNDAAIGAVVLAAYPFFWVGLLKLISWMDGWSRLAVAYRATAPFAGNRLRFVSGELYGGPLFGMPCNFGFCLTLGSCAKGLYLAVALPFRPGHPPLFIPWRDLAVRTEKHWLASYVTFTFEPFRPLRLRISRGLAERLISAAAAADTPRIDS
jgi:hypothetical protein